MKNILRVGLVVLTFLGGYWFAKSGWKSRTACQEEASVLLEKIQTVSKLVTVEGQFSEIYSYSDYEGAFSWLWEKKALVRVRANISAGFDLENMKFIAHPESRTIEMSALPAPQILSIDHTLDYYDISKGIFTDFSPQDYNNIHARAKTIMREQAEKSTLLLAAREQGQKMMDLIKFMVESAGWKLVVVENNATPKF